MQLFKKNKTLVGAYIFFLIISLIASTQLDAQTIQPKDSTALQKDSTALVALYNSTDGPHWKENSGWLSGPIKMWYGIYLNSRLTRVTSIALSDNNLNGTIPSEIGKLTGVRNIMLDNNQLIGTIPSEISNISNLITLNLYKNELSGNIPSSISKLTYLTALNIQYNHFNFSDLYSSSFSPLSQSFVYAPQKKLPEPTLSQDGDEITLAIDEDMASYHIVWYVNGSPVEENNSTFYTFIPTETTTVYVKITDLGYTNLTLETNPVIIEPAQQPKDTTPPVVVTQNISVQLDETGHTSIVSTQIDNGSSDENGIASRTLSQSDFDCDNIGENTVTLTVTDNNGNSTFAYAVVTVEDKTAPVVITQNVTLQLDQNGFASITPEQVNIGSSDACGIASMILSQSDFDCDNIGENTVTLTVTDNSGNSANANAIVTVEDKTAPVAVAQNVTLRLDQNGFASITPEQVNNRSSDACGIASMILSQSDFDCDNIGENTVTLTVTDNNGNSTSANAVVTVEDKTAPVAITRNIKLYLDQNGFASITPEQVNNGSSDACGIASMTLSQTDFDLSMIGQNRVELSVSDISGNISKAEAFVTVLDLVPPTANAQDLIVYLDEEGTATITADQIDNGSSDASGILSKEVIPSSFSCSNVGSNPVILTVTDKNGNISSDTVAVVVLDTIAPVAKARNLTIQLDANGSAHVNASDLNNGSSDACGIVSMQVVPSSFSCENIGENKVIFTVTDNNNNYSSIEATITVEDKIAPTIIAPSDITMNSESETNEDNSDYGWEGFFGWGLYWSWESCFSWNQSPGVYHTRCGSGGGLSGNPGGTTVELGTPVASDNCTIATITNDAPSQFPIGLTIVTWTVTDVNGNSSKTTQNITILDGGSSSNETPMINSMSSNSPVCVNSNATVTALVTDENLIRATWDWGDGTNSETTLSMNQKKVSQSYITASHRYNQSGMYDVTLTIEDKYEKTATMVYRSVVVFDPNNGDITGGGWINSNKGDYVVRKCNEKGNYGFVAQYDKRMNLQGNLTFQLSNSRFTLKSTSLDWLLINDDHALLKGEATVNCMPGYTFLVNAVDIDIHSTNKKDKDIFRIIVWDYDGNIVYDNESSAGMYDRPATPIGSGSIVIHQPKTDNKNHYKSVDITEATSGDADNNLFGNLKVYPNPATCLLNIDLPKRAEQAVSYDIVDVTGKVVTQDAKLELYGQTAWINLESYPMKPGSYILRLKEKDGTQSSWFRFIKK